MAPVCSRLYATTWAQRCERFAALRYCIPSTCFLATAGEAECSTHIRRPQENPRTRFSSGTGLISYVNLTRPFLTRLQLAPEMSSPDDIRRLKQLKESDALQNAWNQWNVSRQVCSP